MGSFDFIVFARMFIPVYYIRRAFAIDNGIRFSYNLNTVLLFFIRSPVAQW